MPGEEIKFRPNVEETIRIRQEKIIEEAKDRIKNGEVRGSIEHDIEFFLVQVPLKTGEMVTAHIPKNSGDLIMGKDEKMIVPPEEAIEAAQRFFPELERPSLKEAVRRLRAYKALK